ncbi:MAG: META domain-containing protein [Halomonas sp.]|nr:META domain-containing protein [Halomonas sp.]MCC5902754.1 META domain-containing protein [Halomonas sp.]
MKSKWLKIGLISLSILVAGCHTYSAGHTSDLSDEPLTNTYWKLVTLGGNPVTTAENLREAHMVLHTDNARLAGSTGCNSFTGRYQAEGKYLTFGQVATTKMACAATQMRNEQEMLSTFKQVAKWRIKGSTLLLEDTNGKPLAELEAVHLY